MNAITDLCFLCTKDYNCVPVDERIMTQVKYILPEITIFKLDIPLRICSVCDGALYAFNKFKKFYMETCQRFEDNFKAQARAHSNTAINIDTDINKENKNASHNKQTQNIQSVQNNPNQIDSNFMDKLSNIENTEIYIKNEIYLEEDQIILNVQDKDTLNSVMEDTQLESSTTNLTKMEQENANGGFDASDNDEEISDEFEESEMDIDKNNIKLNMNIYHYICEFCKESFPTEHTMICHIKTTHSEKKVMSCEVCNKMFLNRSSLKYHRTTNCGEKNYVCHICKKSFFESSKLRRHLSTHKNKAYYCSICPKTFIKRCDFDQHVQNHPPIANSSNVEDFPCSDCKTKVLNKKSTGYIKTAGKFECGTCKKNFTRRTHVIRHLTKHLLQDIFCSTCYNAYSAEQHLQEHMSVQYGIKEYQCDTCKMFFQGKYHLERHITIHSVDKEYWCTLCSKSYTDKCSLNRHNRTVHNSKRDFPCSICKKTFTLKQTLNRHMIVHSGAKKLMCGLCGKSYWFQNKLNRHMKTHTTTDCQCFICKEKFTDKNLLWEHIKTHRDKND